LLKIAVRHFVLAQFYYSHIAHSLPGKPAFKPCKHVKNQHSAHQTFELVFRKGGQKSAAVLTAKTGILSRHWLTLFPDSRLSMLLTTEITSLLPPPVIVIAGVDIIDPIINAYLIILNRFALVYPGM